MVSVNIDNPVHCIKAIRSIEGMNLADAKRLYDALKDVSQSELQRLGREYNQTRAGGFYRNLAVS
jgi:ribosomal protein L7/L12